jgi:hypothetical protein
MSLPTLAEQAAALSGAKLSKPKRGDVRTPSAERLAEMTAFYWRLRKAFGYTDFTCHEAAFALAVTPVSAGYWLSYLRALTAVLPVGKRNKGRIVYLVNHDWLEPPTETPTEYEQPW